MRPWSTAEICYLEEHSADGVESIASALKRSEASVKVQASRYGISLRKRWICPRCGSTSYRPLSSATGWCSNCTKEAQIPKIAKAVQEAKEEEKRTLRNNRERQRLYTAKYRAKEKRKLMKP